MKKIIKFVIIDIHFYYINIIATIYTLCIYSSYYIDIIATIYTLCI